MSDSAKRIISSVREGEGLFEVKGLKDIQWKAGEAGPSDALFYRLPDQSDDARRKMAERLADADYGLVFVNGAPFEGPRDARFMDDETFYSLRTRLADKLYPLPGAKYIAVTGTNGKTTVVDIIRQVLANKGAGVVTAGTLGLWHNDGKVADFGLTSPDFVDLRKALSKLEGKFEVCALEASSHSLSQRRLDGFVFDAIAWTSFSQDHLDYHKTMDAYFEAKKALVKLSETPFLVSPRAKNLRKRLKNLAAAAPEVPAPDSAFFQSEFNRINLDVALGCLARVGQRVSKEEVRKVGAPPGRFNVMEDGRRLFVVDFAHTPEALENIGNELKKTFASKKLVCVFGCGGDRDKSKRLLMGKAAAKFSDYVVVTSDNPRFEDPLAIINDILPGLKDAAFEIVPDRGEAIRAGAKKFEDAVVLVAGKGHEPYLDAGGIKTPYSDREEIEKIISGREDK